MAGPSSEGLLLEAAEGSPRMVESLPGLASVELTADVMESDSEVAHLETLLATRARELGAARAELARLQSLLREAVAHFEATLVEGSAAVDVVELTRQRDLAVGRALEAEAGRAELIFQLDEAMGHLTASGEGGKPGESLDMTCARLAGTVRGLLSALAHMEESRDVADARLLLVEQDLEQKHGHSRALERELAEAREHAELELVRARGIALQRARDAAELHGELAGLRARSAESERAYNAAREVLQRSQRLAAQTQEEVETARVESTAIGTERDSNAARILELEQLLASKTEAGREIGAQTERLSRVLRDVRQALNELPASTQRVLLATGSASSLQNPEGPSSEAPTQPGVPAYIEGSDALDEQVTLRDERIVELSAQLARERGRVATVARTLRDLCAQPAAAPLGQLSELLAWLDRPALD